MYKKKQSKSIQTLILLDIGTARLVKIKERVYCRRAAIFVKRKSSSMAICSIALRIDDWIPDVFCIVDPFQVVTYLEMGVKIRNMRVNNPR